MKSIWPIIGVACVIISAIGRMANSLTDVLIAVGAIALVALVIWLFETGRLRINERLGKVLKKIGAFIFITKHAIIKQSTLISCARGKGDKEAD
ncbi:hypothetical protein [uncultured Duncaniella sp.]|uniref:hypothetical protein n=1 Tax=uncultured Duncaniella sp. TaxID=2768039 RepID=UPI00266EC6B1|nr:hypothetical protein [uncultured Duncaniella sp.]